MNNLATFFRESRTARFFIPAGILLTVFGVAIFIINNQNKDYIKTEAIVSNVVLAEEAYTDVDGNRVDETYNVQIKYTVDGKEYESDFEGISKYNIGDKMTIYYNPTDPSQITQSKSMIFPLVMVGLGIASLVYGIISAVNVIKKHKAMKEQEKGWANAK